MLCLLVLLSQTVAYKPVIMMHGVSSGASEMNTILKVIAADRPGTTAISLPLFEGEVDSLVPLAEQAKTVAETIRKTIAANASLYANGYHMVCKSQGGLTCRVVIEEMNDHNVSTFISLAGPQVGVFGTAFLDQFKIPGWLENVTAEAAWKVMYTKILQDTVSIASMWRDPKHIAAFEDMTTFLPSTTFNVSQANTASYKANFARLAKAVFCVGSGPAYDGGIAPWQTAIFQTQRPDGSFIPMEEQPFYLADSFGLKTLHTTGRLNFTVVPNASHHDWTGDEALIRSAILPHLD